MPTELTLKYKSSRWTNSEGEALSECLVYDIVHVEVEVENTMRMQSVTGLVKVAIYRDVPHGLDVRVKEESRILKLKPLSSGKVLVTFMPTNEAAYHYRIFIEDKEVYKQPNSFPLRLHASKSETILILNELSGDIPEQPVITFAGKLVTASSETGINGARIYIHECDLGRNRIMSSGTTRADGTFSIKFVAEHADALRNIAKTHARFEGDDFYKAATSNHLIINAAHTPQSLITNIASVLVSRSLQAITSRQT